MEVWTARGVETGVGVGVGVEIRLEESVAAGAVRRSIVATGAAVTTATADSFGSGF
jgi:hypothetical protein